MPFRSVFIAITVSSSREDMIISGYKKHMA